MTGIADVYIFLSEKKPLKKWKNELISLFGMSSVKAIKKKFVVLSWEHTGSGQLCDILRDHPEIVMHNELFNEIDIFPCHPDALDLVENSWSSTTCTQMRMQSKRWTVLSRDLNATAFLDYIWDGRLANGSDIKDDAKAVGFKSFLENCHGNFNKYVWNTVLMDNTDVKKIMIHREDEISVFVEMLQKEQFEDLDFPNDLNTTVTVKPDALQAFINEYRYTFQFLYSSAKVRQDTFCVTNEQVADLSNFSHEVLSKLWEFLGVRPYTRLGALEKFPRQLKSNMNLETVIENYDEVEFAFRHTDVSLPKREALLEMEDMSFFNDKTAENSFPNESFLTRQQTWSILLPICSRIEPKFTTSKNPVSNHISKIAPSRDPEPLHSNEILAWKRLNSFAESLRETTTYHELMHTECIVGIDDDDSIFGSKDGIAKVESILPTSVVIVKVSKDLYGKVCKIWNLLASFAQNEFLVLLGDDVRLISSNWQTKIVSQFEGISKREKLPFGAACVAFNDIKFQGFPTFPVIHRWHVDRFTRVLPVQFVNQGGDPFLFELYKRWNASTFVKEARLENTIGGESEARYAKHTINWSSVVLEKNLKKLSSFMKPRKASGICLDVVVPSYRLNNEVIISKILSLRASVSAYVRFWIVVDNVCNQNLKMIHDLRSSFNARTRDGNYHVFVISYGENKGASYARNIGYNYSCSDWVLFLDDDVTPDNNILDAYIGAIRRYPTAKVFVGMSKMPAPLNTWTRMLNRSRVNFFFSIAEHCLHPPWGVTANLLVSGSRHNQTVQFKSVYPKTGGGEDVDFVFQMKHYHGETKKERANIIVSVPEAKVTHPWWQSGGVCYGQLCGWAKGDSLCITEWPDKTFLAFPNWVETVFVALISAPLFNWSNLSLAKAIICVTFVDHLLKAWELYMTENVIDCRDMVNEAMWSFGGSTIISAQEVMRFTMCLYRLSLFSFCRRMDWFDGEAENEIFLHKLLSFVKFVFMVGVLAWFHGSN